MTGETPPPHEQNETAAKFTARLFKELSGQLADAPYSHDGHKMYVGPNGVIEVSDYFAFDLTKARELDGNSPQRVTRLRGMTSIIGIKSEDAHYNDFSQLQIFRPCDLNPQGMIASLMQDFDSRSTQPVVWHSRQGVISEPRDVALIRDLGFPRQPE